MNNVGDKASDFCLKNSDDKDVTLSDYSGKRVMLVFYPKDNSVVCTKQLCEYSDYLENFNNLGINILAISTDSPEPHRAFKEKRNLKFELLSDEEKIVSRAYDVLNLFGMSKRVIILIDETGIIKYKNISLSIFREKKEDLLKLINKIF